nr:S-adenosyl-L-methionine-dependent methyltransferase [Tanacetum cinerariifolium]
MFLEHHGYDLSHWTQTEIEDDDVVYDVGDMEDIIGYGASDFVGEYDVVIPNSQSSGKELDIDSDDEDADKHFKLVDGEQHKECMTNYGVANGYQLWYGKNDYRSLIVLCGRDVVEGRSGGKKGKGVKLSSPTKKGQKGVLLRSPKKGKKGAYIRSPNKKGVQSESSADKGKAEGV